MAYKTEQEEFWAGEFGAGYMERNVGERLVAANFALFSKILATAPGVRSIQELGCNVGLNLQALHRIDPSFQLHGYEINAEAARRARELGVAMISEGTVTEPIAAGSFDLTFTKGVLIHVHPDALPGVYENLYRNSARYIMVCEYYNPTPVEVPYRGHAGRLFKRDFAGELMDRFPLRLVNYGFAYRRDPYFPQDDANWFLMEKA